ncbi:GPI-linked NAD(P)(+)--arginine ADP-ribosyltransferase 1-like, partial [Corapipo altera]|uniref:GPI-linked NAD(P)(+)--arginine ADP-ribosyltransferase 1-like n=1 Tax=Corapipo altera TaxID=415028 RepID=UPI000FD655B9
MALLALLLALPALASATPLPPAPQEVALDMAPSAFDDRYRGCGRAMAAALPALNRSEFPLNGDYAAGWALAAAEWRVRGSPAAPKSPPLSPEQAVALLAYTAPVPLHRAFNAASRAAGRSRREYRDGFHFKALHFLLTGAVGALWEAQGRPCQRVFRGVSGVRFVARPGRAVRFGHFASASRRNRSAWAFGADTAFEVLTCHGAAVRDFSFFPDEDEVLIPPFETFEVAEVAGGAGAGARIRLRSTGTLSNYNCEWLR